MDRNTSLADQIKAAQYQARTLYNDILRLKTHTQNITMQSAARVIAPIPRNSCTLKLYNTLKGHQNKVAKLVWSADSSKILSASQDGYMFIWDPITGFKKHVIQLENTWVLTCSYSADEKLAASGGLDNVCTIYKIKPDTITNPISYRGGNQPNQGIYQKVESVFKGHTAYISECEFIDNSSIVTASGDMTCILWDVTKGRKVRDFIDHVSDILSLAIFPQSIFNANVFISGSADGYAKIWDLRSPTPSQNFFISNSDVNSVKAFPGGGAFITGSDDGLVRLFDMRSDCELSTYNLLAQLQTPGGKISQTFLTRLDDSEWMNSNTSINSAIENQGIYSLDFGKSGRFIYACYSEQGCIVWDTLKNEIVDSVGNDHNNKINQVSVSPDGVALATGSWDTTIKVWSV
ncbi:uncharacterized protein SPAPADRAFT_151428 [Spathaspora passalidarum NRRL Y-27907]|uniref:Uncharacterized protein n=1 Tax=Spathaspora passalidarum (strain NRRL Y-27907 / 11-Y1) TaxID=619300 RepID=G3AM97_SPAPN|nr:uncharacterized protein SPAPADRAFT_151428 [Spathaspora passalidarum NRRL Y-27907]EGW33395.1 hypothetical protein SPAPADRAFT_151428 [Spathaspora passalidarum NRRL Y-27907]